MTHHDHRRIVMCEIPITGTMMVEFVVTDDQAYIDHDYLLPWAEDVAAEYYDDRRPANVLSLFVDEFVVDPSRKIRIVNVDTP